MIRLELDVHTCNPDAPCPITAVQDKTRYPYMEPNQKRAVRGLHRVPWPGSGNAA
jgi:hypothetical protein